MTDGMIKKFLLSKDFEIDSKTDCIRKCLGFSKEELFTFLNRSKAEESKLKRNNNNPTFNFTSKDTIITIEQGVRKNRFINISFNGIENCNC